MYVCTLTEKRKGREGGLPSKGAQRVLCPIVTESKAVSPVFSSINLGCQQVSPTLLSNMSVQRGIKWAGNNSMFETSASKPLSI